MKIPSKYKFWRYPFVLKCRYALTALLKPKYISLKYWINSNIYTWSSKIKPYNWGDFVNVKLAELISGKAIIPYKFSCKKETIAMMGSILPWAIDRDTIVWGSGTLSSQDPLWNTIDKPLSVRAVRGPLTRQLLLSKGIECPEIYGDPALLFPRYYTPNVEKRYKYGVILHVSTKTNETIYSKLNTILGGGNMLIINPKQFSQWHSFIDDICSCEAIVSSSLHGIIIADAYEIPNVWISLDENHPDDNFKFKDYYLSVNKDISKPLNFDTITPEVIQDLLQSWQKPTIDLDKLLSVCPLI